MPMWKATALAIATFVYNATTGMWFTCISTGSGTTGFEYGAGGWRAGWRVLPADFDGDGRTDFLLYDPASAFSYFTGGWSQWTTEVSDLNGDGSSDVFLYDLATGGWYQALTTTPGAFQYTSGSFPR